MCEVRENLITKRNAAGMTQRELADAMEVSQGFVGQFERGLKRWPEHRVDQAFAAIDHFATAHSPSEREAYLAKMRAILDGFNASGWPAEVPA